MEEKMAPKHSIFSILSFILSMVDIFSLFILFIVMGALEFSIEGGIGANPQISNAISLFYLSIIILALIALVFGFFGVVQKDKKRFYGVFGIILSAATLFVSLFILIEELFLKDKFIAFLSL
ncbi:MAG: hypothetical protein LBH45_01800 [Campylobacteraceae bacterium]|jgi:hypothetical protein|nr:hypothetical protein [Campylobacteraceae bacterium]